MLRSGVGLQVRAAAPQEAARIASVLAHSFAEFLSVYTPEAYAATTPNTRQVRQRMKEGPTWVATLSDGIVGTVSAVEKSGSSLYIRGMAVLPSARGQGVGEALLNTIQIFALDKSYRDLFLSTTPFLTAAIRLCERFGFEPAADGPHELFGTPLFTMRKELACGSKLHSH